MAAVGGGHLGRVSSSDAGASEASQTAGLSRFTGRQDSGKWWQSVKHCGEGHGGTVCSQNSRDAFQAMAVTQ